LEYRHGAWGSWARFRHCKEWALPKFDHGMLRFAGSNHERVAIRESEDNGKECNKEGRGRIPGLLPATWSTRPPRPPELEFCLELVHVLQEFRVIADLLETANEKLHGFDGRQRVEHLAEDPDALQVFLGDEQLFLAGAAALDVDGREHALVDQFAVENDFAVAGAF